MTTLRYVEYAAVALDYTELPHEIDEDWKRIMTLADAYAEIARSRAQLEELWELGWECGYKEGFDRGMQTHADSIEAAEHEVNAEIERLSDLNPQWLEWARDMFGEIAGNPQERALRFVEEAVELAQAMELDRAKMTAIVDRVWSRQAGDVSREIGQCRVTLDLLAFIIGVDPTSEAAAEFGRVKSIPKEEWMKRHQAKIERGFALASPQPDAHLDSFLTCDLCAAEYPLTSQTYDYDGCEFCQACAEKVGVAEAAPPSVDDAARAIGPSDRATDRRRNPQPPRVPA